MMRCRTEPSGALTSTRRSLGSTGVTMRPPSGRSSSSKNNSLDGGHAAPQCTLSYCPYARQNHPRVTLAGGYKIQ